MLAAIDLDEFALVGLDSGDFGGHSLRLGFATPAAANGATLFRLMDQIRPPSVETVRAYVRRAGLFEDHAGAGCRRPVEVETGTTTTTLAGTGDTMMKMKLRAAGRTLVRYLAPCVGLVVVEYEPDNSPEAVAFLAEAQPTDWEFCGITLDWLSASGSRCASATLPPVIAWSRVPDS